MIRAQDAVLFNPALGLDFARVVHGDQRFVHHRPDRRGRRAGLHVHRRLVAGRRRQRCMALRTEVVDPSGAPVCTAYGTLVARGPDA